MTNFLKIGLILFLSILSLNHCAERDRDNPLDPNTKQKPDIQLSLLSFNDRIEVYWNPLNISDFVGFNLYRKSHIDSPFSVYAAGLSPDRNNFIDNNISLNNTYFYYLTILGGSSESAPSNIVSTTTGLGYNWIVDKWGYQIIKTTYDGKYQLEKYYTDWPPQDIAVDRNNELALITFPAGGRLDLITTSNSELVQYWDRSDRNFIENPYKAVYEPNAQMFWISDSGGSLYKMSAVNQAIDLVSLDIEKPGEITLNQSSGTIYVIDEKNNEIYLYNTNGNYISKFSRIADHDLNNPQHFETDTNDQQFWLVEEFSDLSYLYQGYLSPPQITLVDSFEYIYDIQIDQTNQLVWVVVYEDINYKILQLSKGGSRQLELTGVYNPFSVAINPYDATLLVADSGNRRIIHYSGDFDILGIFTNLNFPIKINVE